MPISAWLHYGDHALAPLRRSFTGSDMPITGWLQYAGRWHLPGATHEVLVPVDSNVGTVIFSVSIDSKTAVNVVRPSGTLVSPSDADAKIADLSSGRLVSLSPALPGLYRVQITGSGAYSAVAEGRAPQGVSPIQFDSFQFVSLAGRPAHEGYFPISGQPIFGASQTARARLLGPYRTAGFSAISEAGDRIQDVGLLDNQASAVATDFVGDLSLPAQPFRMAVRGLDANGQQYQRVFNPLFSATTISLVVANTTDTLTAGTPTPVAYTAQNFGAAGTFTVVASDGLHAITSVTPSSLTLKSGESASLVVLMDPSASIPDGSSDTLSIKLTSTADPAITNGTVQSFTVTANRPPDASRAQPSITSLWPPNHALTQISVVGVTDPNGDPITISIQSITQNEPTLGLGSGDTCPDAQGLGTSSAMIRAERDGTGHGRVYTISFIATDGRGGSSPGSVQVAVPRDQSNASALTAGLIDSTSCAP
jgi:hypothetical protein